MSNAIAAKGTSLRRFPIVNTSGTAVTWVNGPKFTNALNGVSVTIGGSAYTFTYVSATAGTLGTSAGTQTAVAMTTTGAVFGEIAEVISINGMSLKLDTVDVTTHQSPGGWKEYIGVSKDAGEISFEINYVPADATHDDTTGLIWDIDNRVIRSFHLVFPDNAADASKTCWKFSGLVTSFAPTAPHDGKLSAAVSVKVSGVPILT